MSEPDDELVRSMIWRAIQEIDGLSRGRDYDFAALLMREAVSAGYGFDHLAHFWSENRTNCYGFFRDRTHYAGMCRFRIEFTAYSGIMVQTTGRFEGMWVFLLDYRDFSVLTSHNNEAVEAFDGLEGPDLIAAVVQSALTEELLPPPPPKRCRRRS